MKFITVKKAQLIFHVNPHVHGPMPPFDSPEMCPVCGHYRGQENFCPNCGSSFTLKATGKPHPHAGRPGQQGGSTPSYTYYNHLCKNCGTWLEPDDPEYCPACEYLQSHEYEHNQMGSRGETEGFQRRRFERRQAGHGKLKKADFDGYLAVSPKMSASERYVNSDRLRQLNETEDERRKEADEAAKQSMRNRQPQAAWSEQNKITEQEKVQYEGKHLNARDNTVVKTEKR